MIRLHYEAGTSMYIFYAFHGVPLFQTNNLQEVVLVMEFIRGHPSIVFKEIWYATERSHVACHQEVLLRLERVSHQFH